jgi:isopentenyldiphosphate isomerase
VEARLADVAGPLAPTHRRDLRQGEFHDAELVRSYRLDGYRGRINFDDGEVVEARWLGVGALEAAVAADPGAYTPWLAEEGAALGWFGGGGAAPAQGPGEGSALQAERVAVH